METKTIINLLDPQVRQRMARNETRTIGGHRVIAQPTHDENGLPITYIGLMAQEVEREFPQAITEINGIKCVNYDLALKLIAEN
jgi:hypothetical protein